MELKGEIDKSTTVVGDVNSVSVMDRKKNKKKPQKPSKNKETWTALLDLIDAERTLHTITEKYIWIIKQISANPKE